MLQTTNQIMFKIIHSHGLFFPPRVAVSPRVELGTSTVAPTWHETFARAKRQWRVCPSRERLYHKLYIYIYIYIVIQYIYIYIVIQ